MASEVSAVARAQQRQTVGRKRPLVAAGAEPPAPAGQRRKSAAEGPETQATQLDPMAPHTAVELATDARWKAHERAFEEARGVLRAQAAAQRGRHTELERRKLEMAQQHGDDRVKGRDKLKLNVGGTRVAVRRETLTQFPATRLAVLFSGAAGSVSSGACARRCHERLAGADHHSRGLTPARGPPCVAQGAGTSACCATRKTASFLT